MGSMQNQDMNLVFLSTDAKPRLKWIPELHQRFIDAFARLGGADKATPTALMRMMGIPGLTLYHLKTHLQKYRLGKSRRSETCSGSKEEDYRESQSRDVHFNMEISDGTQIHFNASLKVDHALQMQMEVQRKLHEQIEVQRHLQLRIEAQGKYLQSVLKKAQETLAGYNPYSAGVELANAKLSQLVSMVNTGCTSPLSELTEEAGNLSIEGADRKMKSSTDGSMESSLTSSESSGRNEEKQLKLKTGDTDHMFNITPVVLPLMENLQGDHPLSKKGLSNGRRRNGSGITISDGNCFEQQPAKRSLTHKEKDGNQLRYGFSVKFDLNSQYQIGINSGPKALDLNLKGIEQLNGDL